MSLIEYIEEWRVVHFGSTRRLKRQIAEYTALKERVKDEGPQQFYDQRIRARKRTLVKRGVM